MKTPALAYRTVHDGDGYARWVRELRGKAGVYVIRDSWFHELLYVGESHRAGRLYKTLTRHFSSWNGQGSGPTFDRELVDVAVIVTSPAAARELEAHLIEALQPSINVVGLTDPGEVPF